MSLARIERVANARADALMSPLMADGPYPDEAPELDPAAGFDVEDLFDFEDCIDDDDLTATAEFGPIRF